MSRPRRREDRAAPRHAPPPPLTVRILQLTGAARAKGLREAQIQEALRPEAAPEAITRLLESMVTTGRLVRVASGHLVNPAALGWIVGRLQVTRRGHGYVIPEAAHSAEDLLIPERALGTALTGDRVAAQITGRERGAVAGAVVEILARAHARLVGQYFHDARQARVVPRQRRLERVVLVPPLPRGQARDGLWVLAEVTGWGRPHEELTGRVTQVLGEISSPDTDLPVVLSSHGVETEFPSEVLREVEDIPLEIPPEVLARRLDLRQVPVVTIDPETAKDFDDALSCERLGQGRWRLGVHIADVAEHVRPGTALDREALERGTSIYPLDTVIPMLPERLSNLVCSLRPAEDKLTVSVFMEIDEGGDFAARPTFAESVIRSARRLDYGQVQRHFDGETTESDRDATTGLETLLADLRDVSRALRDMRRRRGALDLDLPEVEIFLDEDRRVTQILRRERWESHRLVEDCMLAANEAVARELMRRRVPAIYRDHDEPDPARLEKLVPVLGAIGIRERLASDRPEPRHYQAFLLKTMDHPARRVIHRLLLRTLMLAKYDPENRGHFGLASPCYTHFTSPIRRYPDLLVHRILKSRLRGEPVPEGPALEVMQEQIAAIAKLSSARERRSEAIERELDKLKTLRFLEPRLGEEMTGLVAGVAAHGLWIELDEIPAEGFIHLSSLPEDWYEYDEVTHTLRGEHTGAIWRLAQPVTVRLVATNTAALELTLAITSPPRISKAPRRQPAPQRRWAPPRGRQGKRRHR